MKDTCHEPPKTLKISARLSHTPEFCYPTSHIVWPNRHTYTWRARVVPRSSVRHLTAISRTCSCTGRGLDVLSRWEHGQSRRTARERSCNARKQPTHSVRWRSDAGVTEEFRNLFALSSRRTRSGLAPAVFARCSGRIAERGSGRRKARCCRAVACVPLLLSAEGGTGTGALCLL